MPHRIAESVKQKWTSASEYVRTKTAFINEHLNRISSIGLIKATVRGLGEHDATHYAAGIAYFAILSIFPLLLGLIAIFGIFLPSESIQKELLEFFEKEIPGSVDVLEKNIDDVIRMRGPIGIIGLIGLFWAGSAVFSAVTRVLNRTWGIHNDRPFYVRKVRDLSMAFGLGILLLLSLGMSSLFSILRGIDAELPSIAFYVLSWLAGFAFTFTMFLITYRFVPNIKVTWRLIWPGALVAASLFEIGKYLFILYLNTWTQYEIIYGSVTSLIVMLIWVYISAFIFIIGAEFSSQYSKLRSDKKP